MKLHTIQKAYIKKYLAFNIERKRLRNQLDELDKRKEAVKKQLEELDCPWWGDEILKRIARQLIKQMPGRRFEILGPFGIGATTSIHFYKKGVDESEQFSNGNCRSITFRPRDLGAGEIVIVDENIVIVDENKDTKKYPVNSIAEMSGFNRPEIDIDTDIDIEELMKYVN